MKTMLVLPVMKTIYKEKILSVLMIGSVPHLLFNWNKMKSLTLPDPDNVFQPGNNNKNSLLSNNNNLNNVLSNLNLLESVILLLEIVPDLDKYLLALCKIYLILLMMLNNKLLLHLHLHLHLLLPDLDLNHKLLDLPNKLDLVPLILILLWIVSLLDVQH
jgi:hypothetical protein